MSRIRKPRSARTSIRLCLLVFAAIVVTAVWMRPAMVSSQSNDLGEIPATKPVQNFDIRDSLSADEGNSLTARGLRVGTPANLASTRQRMTAAHDRLRAANPGIDVEWSKETGGPEVVRSLSAEKLSGPTSAGREQVLRGFLQQNADLYGLSKGQVTGLRKTADYENPESNMSWVEFEQQINGIPVFQGNIRAGFSKAHELVGTSGSLVNGVDTASLGKTSSFAASLSSDPGSSAANAVASGAQSIGVDLSSGDLQVKEVSPDGLTVTFDAGPFTEEIKAEMVYFPLEQGVVTPAWSMVLWEDYPAYYTLIDAETGQLLWRKNITNDQTQTATYSVYDNDSPAPLSPFVGLPGSNIQGTFVPRTSHTIVSELPAFDNLGWITDGGNTTTGNNVDAGLDVVTPNGIDAGGRPTGSPNRVFDFPYDPAVDAPSGANYRSGAVTNIFFWANRYHDIMYQYGFTEAGRNFQQNNFGRGGLGNDFVRAEAQDFNGTNNANFATPPDGSLPRMQMFIWPGPNPDRDGDLDQSVSLHEMTHGLSNRLHNNAAGLNAVISGGMGEGWSDFYARMILSSADEDVDGIFGTGQYATNLAATGFTDNYYYGIRRFPSVVKSNVGPNGKPHNPLTLADIDPNTIDLTDGAFARGPFGVGGRLGAVAVHNIGEVWSIALLEVRARIIHRLGYAVGNARMLQLTTDAMKLDPTSPTLLEGRNSLIAADIAGFGGEDVLDIWAGFATRGMGFGATITPEAKSTSNAKQNVKESFDYPIPGMGSVTVAENSCHSNGNPDVGEPLILTVPLTNPLANDVTNVSAQVVDGSSAAYGTIAPGATVTHDMTFQVPSNAVCGSKITVSVVVTSNLGTETKTFPIRLGKATSFFAENFDGVTAPNLPAGWTTTKSNSGTLWTTTTTTADTPPNSVGTVLAATTGRADLITPPIAIPASGTTQLTFRHSYNTEWDWDGGALFIRIDGVTPPNTFTEILAAGGTFETGGYNWALESSGSGNTNPLASFAAWSGNSGGFITTTVNLPATAAGHNVQFIFIAGSDSSTTPAGAHWRIDSLSINTLNCDTVTTTTTAAASTGQYSDPTTLSATLSADCVPTGSMEFRVDGVLVGTVPVNGTGTYSTNYIITNAPGSHTITANFVSDNPFFGDSSGSNTLTVTQEDASVTFPANNPFSVKVNSPGGTAGPITFCADITEVPDGSAGDISNATASFTFNPVAGSGLPTVGPVSYSAVGASRRACVILTDVPVDVFDITVTVGGYYIGSGNSVLAIFDPSLGFITGGGRVMNPNTGCTGNFELNAKFKKDDSLQGSNTYRENCANSNVNIDLNVLQSMSLVGDTAVLLGKATVGNTPDSSFRLIIRDNGEPGRNDLFGLTITNPDGSANPTYSFAPRTISGGNIQVHHK